MKQKPLRTIVLYSAGHLGSATILNRLAKAKEMRIVGVIKARPASFTSKGVKKLKKHLKKVGWRFGWLIFWQQLIQVVAYGLVLITPFLRRRLTPGWVLAKQKGIPIHYCKSINDKECLDVIRALKPDLIISAYFNQILKKEAIQAPRIGVLNVHPGWLPAYRGAMCYFWVLKNAEERGGVTVHWIDEGIDTGEILARKSFHLKAGWTQQKVLALTAIIGARLLKRIGRKLYNGEQPAPMSQPDREGAAYYPMPAEADFEDYFAERRYFRIRDIFGFFMGRSV